MLCLIYSIKPDIYNSARGCETLDHEYHFLLDCKI